jgi:hypothetical protein
MTATATTTNGDVEATGAPQRGNDGNDRQDGGEGEKPPLDNGDGQEPPPMFQSPPRSSRVWTAVIWIMAMLVISHPYTLAFMLY